MNGILHARQPDCGGGVDAEAADIQSHPHLQFFVYNRGYCLGSRRLEEPLPRHNEQVMHSWKDVAACLNSLERHILSSKARTLAGILFHGLRGERRCPAHLYAIQIEC